MVAQIAQVQVQITTTTEIISSYTSEFDGTTNDVIRMTYADGTTETRFGWTETNFDGETTFYIKTSKGNILNSNWKTTQTNKWLVAYKQLWIQRHQQQSDAFLANMEIIAQPEHFSSDEYSQAKADLGFDW